MAEIFTRRAKSKASQKPTVLKINPPRTLTDPDDVSRFTNEVNRALALVSDRFNKLAAFTDLDVSDLVTRTDLEDILNEIDANQGDTSENDTRRRGSENEGESSIDTDDPDESAEAAIENAVPTVAPPAVDRGDPVVNLGTTTDPVLFALSDHTHRGVTLPLAIVAVPRHHGFASGGGTAGGSADSTKYKRIFLLMGA